MNEETLFERLWHLPWWSGENGKTHCAVTLSDNLRRPYFVIAQTINDRVRLKMRDAVIPHSALAPGQSLGREIIEAIKNGDERWELTQATTCGQSIQLIFFNHHISELGRSEAVNVRLGGEERVQFWIQTQVSQDRCRYFDDVAYLVTEYDGWPCVTRKIACEKHRSMVIETTAGGQCAISVTDYLT